MNINIRNSRLAATTAVAFAGVLGLAPSAGADHARPDAPKAFAKMIAVGQLDPVARTNPGNAAETAQLVQLTARVSGAAGTRLADVVSPQGEARRAVTPDNRWRPWAPR